MLAVILAARTASSPLAAAARAAACFVSFVVVYYGVTEWRFHEVPLLYATAWLVMGVVGAPVASAAVQRARASAKLAPVVAAVAGAGVVADGSVGVLLLGMEPIDTTRGVLLAADLVVVAAALVTIPRTARGRLAAVLLAIPFGAVATLVGFVAHYGLGPYGQVLPY